MLIRRSLILLAFLTASLQLCSAKWDDFLRSDKKKLKILAAFGHPGKSHFDFFKPLLIELSKQGHEMTVISFFPRTKGANDTLQNYRDIDLRESDSDVFVNVVDLDRINDESPVRVIGELLMLRHWALEFCEKALKNQQVQQLLGSNEKFDLILTEAFNSDCLLCLVEKFKAPFIALSSHEIMPWVLRRFDNPYELSYASNTFVSSSYYMNFVERLTNVVSHYFALTIYDLGYQTFVQKLLGEHYKLGEIRRLNDIAKDTSAIFLNTHFSYNGARPLLPNIVEVGGLHLFKEVQKLPDDIQQFLDNAKEGVLYFNFGSMVKSSTMPKDKLNAIVKVLKGLPVKVIWKWEAEDFPEKLPNLMLKKWLPQYDILQHPNVVAYLGHGGLLGMSEGIYAGVPMVLIPFYGDQFHNAATVTARGVARTLRFGDLNEHNLRSVINEVLNDKRYHERARMLSKAYRDRPRTPLETAVWWCEYIGRNKKYNYLRSAAARLPWYQYYLLDVIAAICAALLISLGVTWHLVKFLFFKAKDGSGKKKQH